MLSYNAQSTHFGNWSKTNSIVRLRAGGVRIRQEKSCGTDEKLQTIPEQERRRTQNLDVSSIQSEPSTPFFKRLLSWRISENSYYFRILFLAVEFHIIDEPHSSPPITPYQNESVNPFPVLRLRGGGPRYPSPLRIRGGSPNRNKYNKRKTAQNYMPSVSALCQDLMDDYNKVMSDYKKALGPCGLPTCPLNFNILEEKCKNTCDVKCDKPYCPPKIGPCEKPLCPHYPDYSFGDDYDDDEDDAEMYSACYASCVAPKADGRPAVPCGRTECPFTDASPDLCPPLECPQLEDCNEDNCLPTPEPCVIKEDPLKKEIKCNKHICPYKEDKLTIDDVNPFNEKIKGRKGCGSPFCPHSNKYVIEPEVIIPAFPCKKPCPSLDELPPIHWDCPDPLPQGECTNPYCPLKPKLPCGHCPIDSKHCGMLGCQFAGSSICPPTCPYTQKKPPKDIECTPSVCPLVRPDGYKKTYTLRKDKPCGDRCPYAEGNVKKKSCGNALCPYRTCIDTNEMEVKDCGNPMCPYNIVAKKRVEVEKRRAKEKEEKDLEGVFLPVPVSKDVSAATKTSQHDGEETTENTSKLERKVSKVTSKASTIGLLKALSASIHQMKMSQNAEQVLDTNVCQKISCAQFHGDRICKKCIQRQRDAEAAGTDPVTSSTKKAKSPKSPGKKKKKHRGYVYDKGTYYPGVHFGHKDCGHEAKRVPWDMGWRWNIHPSYSQLKKRPGWRPGAIGKTMLKFINAERKKLGLPPRPMLRHPLPKRRSSRASGIDLFEKIKRSKSKFPKNNQLSKPKPTLTVKKKDGVVYVTMNPLKDPKTMGDYEYPYIDCSPLEFKIIKKKQDDQFKKCLCSGDDPDGVEVSDDKSSELDIEFTPPAGIVRPEVQSKNKHMCHTESQYDKNDILSPETGKKKGKGGKNKKGKKGKKGKKRKKGKK